MSEGTNDNSQPADKTISKGFIIGLVAFLVMIAIGAFFVTLTSKLKVNTENILPPASSHIYDSAGNEIANIHAIENRIPVKLEQIPKNLQNAFIAIEDNRFYEHNGVDLSGIGRAIISNIQAGKITEGGSTITQQLAKNAYLNQERTFKRKIQEILLALKIEKKFTKDEILELYLNQVYFGQGAYGVQAAALTYFNKSVEELDLNECALLAGIPKSPNYYSPFNNLKAAIARRDVVLNQMMHYGYLNYNEVREVKKMDIVLAPPSSPENGILAYFIDYVTQVLFDKYGTDAVYKGGLKVYTTIDMHMQEAAEQALLDYLPNYYTDDNGIEQPQGAIVAIEPSTGYIRAMVGGRGTDQFNRAAIATRQPGSAFKPFVFITALEDGFSPSSVINDSPINIGGWSPRNDSGRFSGNVTLRTIATFSINVPTVKLAQAVGMDRVIYKAQDMGITTFVVEGEINDMNYATALGGITRGVTPLELTSAYGTFANAGVHVPYTAITKVLDRDGNVIYEAVPEGKKVISSTSASELTSMLEDVIYKGTGRGAAIGRPAAGKSGTTDNYIDAWFVGYTPDLVAAVWIGNDDNSSLGGMYGGGTPATIWGRFMRNALVDIPVSDFYFPPDEKPLEEDNSTETETVQVEQQSNRNYDSRNYYAEERSYSETIPEISYERNIPTYREPEPIYEERNFSTERYEPEPIPKREPEPVTPEVPLPGGSLSKGRN